MTPPPMPSGEQAIRFVDERLGTESLMKKALRYVFPDHWSFMLGEIALYAFVTLVATGIFMALLFEPSKEIVVYTGSYQPLYGQEMSAAYRSVLEQSFDVKGGLLIRQTHHWAANVFFAAIVLHLLRNFFTGAFRKPRELNWMIGLTILLIALPEALLGYAMIDDLLSGMGLVIAYAVGLSIPFIGSHATILAFGGEFPGSPDFWPRMFIFHTLLLPMTIAGLIGLHLMQIVRQHHTQFPGPGRTERNVVGTPMWPGYALRSLGLMGLVVGLLFLMGGLIQINPVWEWGPYHPYQSFNGAQPDWYLGWLIGGLRLMLPFEPHVWDYTLVPNAFWGGALFPLVVFAVLYAWPWLERRYITNDYGRHELLDRPRDNPTRTAFGVAFFSWIVIVLFAGAFDRVAYRLWIPYEGQIWFWRFASFLVPVGIFFLTRRVCRELRASGTRPLRGWYGSRVVRGPSGGFVPAGPEAGAEPTEEDAQDAAVADGGSRPNG